MASSRFITDQQLTKRDLATIQNYLAKTTDKWIDIGIQLQIDPDYLEGLRSKKKASSKDNLRSMILTWLKGEVPVPTWRALCDALRAAAVDEAGVAERIEKEQLVVMAGGENETDVGAPSQSEPQPDDKEDAGQPQTTSLPKSAENSQSEEADTTATATAPDPFPHLNTSGLTASQKSELCERLLEESIAIRLSFTSLVSSIEISLVTRCIDTLSVLDKLQTSAPHHYKRVSKLVDVSEIMGQLKEYSSFVDYSLLDLIVQELGTHEDREHMTKYKETLAEFLRRRIFECPTGIFGNATIGEDEKNIVVKWTDTKTILYDLSLNQVEIFASIFCKELDIDDCDVRLMQCQISDRSLVLSFGVLSSAVASCFPLSDEKKEKLVSLGVWRLDCEDYTFQHQKIREEVDGEPSNDEDDEEQIPEESLREASLLSVNEPMIQLKNTVISTDEDTGLHTSIGINNKKLIVEVSNSTSSYKAYKVGRQKGGSLEWLSSAKGLRYGMGKSPRIALNEEGYVVEVDEESNGHISCRVGVVHASNMMIWTESSIFTAGSGPSIAIRNRVVIVAFKRADDAFYRIGTLDVDARSITWSAQEHRFVNGVSDIAIACNSEGIVVSIYTKQTVSLALSSVYAAVGVLQAREKTIQFSSVRSSSQSVCEGALPSVAVIRGNVVMMVCTQQKSAIQKKIKCKLGFVKKATKTNTYNLVWSSGGEETLDTEGKKASVAMNDRGTVVVSHSGRGRNSCHLGKTFVYRETTI